MDYYLNDQGEQVQAMHLTSELIKVAAVWSDAIEVEEIDPFDDNNRFPALNLQTRQGVQRASLGDYILKYPDGSFDVQKPGEFQRNHQRWEP